MKISAKKADFKGKFSRKELSTIFDYLEVLEKDMDTKLTFNAKQICEEFTAWESLEAFQTAHNAEDYPNIEAIEQDTIVLPVSGESFITVAF